MQPYYDDIPDEEEGPIIQDIPDGLMVGDYIEIHGVCRGPEVIVELLSREGNASVPLHIRMSAGGPVSVKSQLKDKVEEQERNVRMGLQPNLGFELIIYAMKNEYEIKLNKNTVCTQRHLVGLEEVSAIAMDGDADFTSIEFKDIYGDEEEIEDTFDATQPIDSGITRAHEARESFSRNKTSPMIVRSSLRRSNRSDKVATPKMTTPSAWSTSLDLSRPDSRQDTNKAVIMEPPVVGVQSYNVHGDISGEGNSPKARNKFGRKIGSKNSLSLEGRSLDVYTPSGRSSAVIAGDLHQGTYRLKDDYNIHSGQGSQTLYAGSLGTLNDSKSSLQDKPKKKRTSLFGKLRKSKGSESDVSVGGTEKKHKRKSLKNIFKNRKSVTLVHTGDISQSSSLPDISTPPSSLGRHSGEFRMSPQVMRADHIPIRGPVPKSICKEPAPEIAAYMAGQKATPDFENFTMTASDDYVYSNMHRVSNIQLSSPHTPAPKDHKFKGPAPETADVLFSSERPRNQEDTTLTNDQYIEQMRPSFNEPVRDSLHLQDTSDKRKLKGTAPEIAVTLSNKAYDPIYNQDTTLTDQTMTERIAKLSDVSNVQTTKPFVEKTKQEKLKGPAPEVAADVYEENKGRLRLLPETTLTEGVMVRKSSYAAIETPGINRTSYGQPISVESPRQSKPTYSARCSSLHRNERVPSEGDDSSIQSDGEYYLAVGRSDYYFDRRKSLKNYRSRRSYKLAKRSEYPSDNLDDSARSSVSSLKSNERIALVSQEPRFYSTYSNRPKVYAAAPIVQQLDHIELIQQAEELQDRNFWAQFPLALIPGRSARVTGYFIEEFCEQKCCIIQLSTNTHENDLCITKLLLQLWQNGTISIFSIQNGNQYKLVHSKIKFNDENNNQFTFEFHARGPYFAISVNNFKSLVLKENFDSSTLKSIQLLTCADARLDHFSVSRELLIPLVVFYPSETHELDTQCLTLSTRMTADSRNVHLAFTSQNKQKFNLILDFVDDYICAQMFENDSDRYIEASRQAIPLVPEQIHQLVVMKPKDEDRLMVLANQINIYNELLPVSTPHGELSCVRISGDMLLLNIDFN